MKKMKTECLNGLFRPPNPHDGIITPLFRAEIILTDKMPGFSHEVFVLSQRKLPFSPLRNEEHKVSMPLNALMV
jgi:hypothetical protein